MKLISRILAVGVCTTLCFLSLSSVMAETIVLKSATHLPVKHRLIIDAYNVLDQEIVKRTNGRIKIESYHAATLVKAGKNYEAVKAGMIDIGLVPIGAFPHLFPVSVGIGLPFMSESAKHSVEFGKIMYSQIPEIKAEFSDVKLLFLCSTGALNLHSTEKRVRKLEDLKGFRLGTAWGAEAIFKPLPCAVMELNPSNIYLSLQRGTVDSVALSFASIRTFKVTDLAKYHTVGNFSVMPVAIVMSKKAYNKLPPDLQKVFDDLIDSFSHLWGLTSYNEGNWAIKALEKRGDTLDYLSETEIARWKKPMEPIYKKYIESLNKKGMDGEAILKKIQDASEYTKKNPYDTIDEWWKQGKMGTK